MVAPTGEKTGSQRKLFQETSMFLVYGALVKEKQPTGRHAEPIVSFFAYPLVDQASLMDHILLNTRSLDRMKQETAKAEVEPERAVEDFVSYDDPVVDSIMNGCDSEHESGYSSDRAARKDMDLDEGVSPLDINRFCISFRIHYFDRGRQGALIFTLLIFHGI
jgi:hypothetical protein